MVKKRRPWIELKNIVKEEAAQKNCHCKECDNRIQQGQTCVVARKFDGTKVFGPFCSRDCQQTYEYKLLEVRHPSGEE